LINLTFLIAIFNFISLLISFVLMGYLYILSLQPAKRSEKYGEKAWKDCKKFRSLGGVFELISVINLILWIWYPLPVVGGWLINSNIWIGIIIGLCILIPCGLILGKGVIDAGAETLSPSKETEMYGGIYEYIRHPQTLGEFPMFVAFAFFLNSWFLVTFSFIGIIIYIPIMVHYEEKDLIRRFGEKYHKYQERTGAFIPRIIKRKNSHNN
jgi:protein-S-isoprenylcysteine O-methyltransferase Ste14